MNVRKNINYSRMYAAIDDVMAQNLPQTQLYRSIGKIICTRSEKGAAVMASEYLNKQYPDVKGFSPRSMRRMRDFYRTYENHPDLMSRAMKLGWIQNVVIMEADLTMELREWYMKAVIQRGWSKTKLIAMIALEVHLEIVLDNDVEICDNGSGENEIFCELDGNGDQTVLRGVSTMLEGQCSNFKHWDSDNDVIATTELPLLPKEHPAVQEHSPWAYSLNTATGFFFMHSYSVPECQVIKGPAGRTIEIRSEKQITTLQFTDLSGTQCLFEDVTVWVHNYFHEFMIVTLHQTDQTILIDSRGIPFILPISGIKHYHTCTIEKNKREGYYLVERAVIVHYKTKAEQSEFEEKTGASLEAVFNKEFNRFSRTNAKNNKKYLYLTAGNSKCGSLVRHFIDRGMLYEIVPNVLLDDDTLNIRIPLEGSNALRKDVQFLCAKYHNTYSIYNIPYTEVGSTLELSRSQKAKYEKLRVFFHSPLNSGHESISYFIINTLRAVFNTDDDYEVYKKVFSPIIRLIDRGRGELEKNCFQDLLLLHPAEYHANDDYVMQRMEYINDLLISNGYAPWDTLRKESDSAFMFYKPRAAESNAYRVAYDCSKRRFKQEMVAYESDAIYQISQGGGAISKWTSEATLFALVKKEYPDTIYQYHSDWLGLQSLDIYIPSLRVGIEYQGEQHYRPVEIFGGEASFKSLVERDKRKVSLCLKNNVSLIHWKYDEVISVARLKKKIHEIKGS